MYILQVGHWIHRQHRHRHTIISIPYFPYLISDQQSRKRFCTTCYMLLEPACSSSAPLDNHETLGGALAAPVRSKDRHPTARRGRCREQRPRRAAAGEVWPCRREGGAMERLLGENATKISKTQFVSFLFWGLEWSWRERMRRRYHKENTCCFDVGKFCMRSDAGDTLKTKTRDCQGFPCWCRWQVGPILFDVFAATRWWTTCCMSCYAKCSPIALVQDLSSKRIILNAQLEHPTFRIHVLHESGFRIPGPPPVGGNFWVYVARALFSYKLVQCFNINLH